MISSKFITDTRLHQWLTVLLPFSLLLLIVFLPFFVRIRLRKPWRRFRTKWLGLNVFLGAEKAAVVENVRDVDASREDRERRTRDGRMVVGLNDGRRRHWGLDESTRDGHVEIDIDDMLESVSSC